MKKFSMMIITMLILFIIGCSNGEAESSDNAGEYPSEDLTVIVPFGAGGGTDLYIREIMDIMKEEEIYSGNIMVENREGGSGATGYSYLNKKSEDPYFVGPTAASFFTTPLVSEAGYNVEDFTPIALMGADDLFLMVNFDSDIESLDDFIETAKNETVRIGGVGQVSDERIVPEQLAEEAGFEFEYVPFQGAGELTSALTSNSLDAIVGNPTRSMGQIESDMFRPLAFSGLERYEELDNVPTFIEEGYEVNISQPRGIILPPEVDEDVKAWWVEAMKQVAETERWQDFVKNNGMSDYVLFGEDFEEYINETNQTFTEAVDKFSE